MICGRKKGLVIIYAVGNTFGSPVYLAIAADTLPRSIDVLTSPWTTPRRAWCFDSQVPRR